MTFQYYCVLLHSKAGAARIKTNIISFSLNTMIICIKQLNIQRIRETNGQGEILSAFHPHPHPTLIITVGID